MAQLPTSHLRLADLSTRRATQFDLVPTADERKAVAETLGISGIKKLRFTGELSASGKSDWSLTAKLGATVVQECVITLEPVSTRIDETLARRYMAEIAEIDASEVEMTEDETIDPLPDSIDLAQVMIEALSLALPPYPRSEGADLGETVYTEPGTAPMTDEDAKPFAGLGALKEVLEKKGK